MAPRKAHPVTGTLVSQAEYERAMKTLEAGQKQAEIEAERLQAEADRYLGPQGAPRQDDEAPGEWDRIREAAEKDNGGPMLPYPRGHEPPARSNALIGCAVAMMFIVIIVLCGVVGWLLVRTQATPGQHPVPTPAPVVVPAVNLDAIVAPLKTKLSYDPEKAKVVYRLYSGFSEALAGKSGDRIVDTRVLENVTQAYLSDANAMGGTPIGREIDEAIAAHLGIGWGSDAPGEAAGWEFKAFTPGDRAKLVEITNAIANAAKETL